MADAQLIFIAGTSYSGSTLLSFLLNAHPQIASIGEPTGPIADVEDPDRYPCSCGAELASCPFWRDVQSRMAARGMSFGPRDWRMDFDLFHRRLPRQLAIRSLRWNALDRARDALVWRLPGVAGRLEERGRRVEALVDCVLEASAKSIFADASKDMIRARLLERFTRFRPRVVHLVRDAPGFVASALKNTHADLDWAIRTWNRVGGHVERLFAELREERRLRIRYEDLCTDVDGTLARIVRFAGAEPVSGDVDFRAAPHHVIGNRMRLRSSGEVRLDTSWRERLSAEELETVLRRTAARRARFGYGDADVAPAISGTKSMRGS